MYERELGAVYVSTGQPLESRYIPSDYRGAKCDQTDRICICASETGFEIVGDFPVFKTSHIRSRVGADRAESTRSLAKRNTDSDSHQRMTS